MAFDRAKTMKLAEKYVKANKLRDAVTEYKKLADDNPRDMGIVNKLGDLLARGGKVQEANRYFLRIAEFYAKDGFFLKAIAMYKKISKIDPGNFDCLQRLADLYTQQGLTIEAKAQYLHVADLMIKKEQLQPAAEILPKVLEIEPGNFKVRKTLAEIYVRIGQPEDAGREFAALARSLFCKGRNDEALLVVRKASRVTGGETEILGLLLEILRKGEQPIESIVAAAEEIAGIHKDKPLPMAVLGEACRRSGDTARADKVFGRLSGMIQTSDSGAPEVAEIVGRFHLSKDQPGEAIEWCIRAAEGYQEANRPTEAAAVLDEFLESHPEDRTALSARVELAARAEDRDAEMAALERLVPVLKAAAETERAREAAQRLVVLDPDNAGYAEILQHAGEVSAVPIAPEPAQSAAAEVPEPELQEAVAPEAPEAEPAVAAIPVVEESTPDEDAEEILTIEEEIEIETEPEAPAPARDETLIGSAEQESSGQPSRIQAMQAAGDDGPEDEDFISEHFTEAEVFLKYGLHEKAKTQLLVILERYPRHIDTHLKLKELFISEGNRDKAIDACLAVADIESARDNDEKAREMVNEAVRIDPGNSRATQYAARFTEQSGPAADEAAEAEGLSLDLEPSEPVTRVDDEITFAAEDNAGSPVGGADSANPDGEKLGEIDFYIDQGLNEEAEQILLQLQKQYPHSPEVARRMKRLESPEAPAPAPPVDVPANLDSASGLDLEVEMALSGRRPGASKPKKAAVENKPAAGKRAAPADPPITRKSKPVFRMEESKGGEDGDFFDLASELDSSLGEAQAEADSHENELLEGPGHTFDDIFQAFKKGVEQQVDSEDFDTHYNLGIAYREMGLVDEAIGEFQFAAKDPSRIVECCGVLGLCFRDKGMPDLALQWYKKGLDMPGLGQHVSVGLRYDMAEVYRESGDYGNALKIYTEVFGVDSTYRDVSAKIQEMRGLLG